MSLDETLSQKADYLMSMLLEATEMPGVKAWALQITFTYILARDPMINKREVWKVLQRTYQDKLRITFPGQEDPAQSFRRASGDAFEAYLEAYLNSNLLLQREGIRAVRLKGNDFAKLMSGLGILDLQPKDVDVFLQGVDEDGRITAFGAIFPKVSYAERIRADEYASRSLISKGLWSGTVTLDARNELGTETEPSVKRQKINSGAFHSCYSFNSDTAPGLRINVIDCRISTMSNPLIRDIVGAWRQFRDHHSIPPPSPL